MLSTQGAISVLALENLVPWSVAISVCVAGGVVALIGFIDDRDHVAPRWRLLGHFAASLLVLFSLGGFPPVEVLGMHLPAGWISSTVATFYLVWMLNLTNFMDGIDGIAGLQVITACLSSVFLARLLGLEGHLWIAPLMCAIAVMGFLIWNWPPARIFMGDAGSGFLGLTMGTFSLHIGQAEPRMFWCWIILFGVFIVDATVTLIWRLSSGEKVFEAHSNHAYQHATQYAGRHLPVTLAVGAINLGWLLPVASAVAVGRLGGALGVLIAYAPLVMVALRLKAGRPIKLRL